MCVRVARLVRSATARAQAHTRANGAEPERQGRWHSQDAKSVAAMAQVLLAGAYDGVRRVGVAVVDLPLDRLAVIVRVLSGLLNGGGRRRLFDDGRRCCGLGSLVDRNGLRAGQVGDKAIPLHIRAQRFCAIRLPYRLIAPNRAHVHWSTLSQRDG